MAVHIAVAEAAFRVAPSLPAWPLVPVPDAWMVAVDVSLGVSAMVVYTALGEWLSGATVGKLLTGLRTVRDAPGGGPVSPASAVVRNLAFLVDALFFGLVAYSAMARSDRRQRVGDRWAGTLVVWKGDAPPRPAWGVPAGALAALVLLLVSYMVVP